MIQRDYVLRLIAQFAEGVGRLLQLRRAGELDAALQLVGQMKDHVLGPLRPVVERLEATSVVELAGRFELERVRMYAALEAEEGAVHEVRHDAGKAAACYRRALELYAAASQGGVALEPADRERVALLSPQVAVAERYRGELARIASGIGPATA